jgi:hypothetical protein
MVATMHAYRGRSSADTDKWASIRLDHELWKKLKADADREMRSLNSEILLRLRASVTDDGEAAAA